jgi:hypothetical protein
MTDVIPGAHNTEPDPTESNLWQTTPETSTSSQNPSQSQTPPHVGAPVVTVPISSAKDYLACRICGKPVRLGADTATDEHGQTVHEDCQVKRILETHRRKPRFSTPLSTRDEAEGVFSRNER